MMGKHTFQPRMKLLEDQLRSWQGIAGVVSLLIFFSARVAIFFQVGMLMKKINWVKRNLIS